MVTIGLLNRDLLNLTIIREEGHYEEVCREALIAYVRWLPEIQLLAPRIRNMMSFISTSQEVWSSSFTHVAAIAGWNSDYEALKEQFTDSKIDYLLHDKVILPVGDRYEVSSEYRPRN